MIPNDTISILNNIHKDLSSASTDTQIAHNLSKISDIISRKNLHSLTDEAQTSSSLKEAWHVISADLEKLDASKFDNLVRIKDRVHKIEQGSPLLSSIHLESPGRRTSINKIISYLNKHQYFTKQEIIKHEAEILEDFAKDPEIFENSMSADDCYQLFEAAISQFGKISENAKPFKLSTEERAEFNSNISAVAKKMMPREASPKAKGASPKKDLPRITKSYDQLQEARIKLDKTHSKLSKIIEQQDFTTVDHLILGAGHAASVLWQDKHKREHGKTQQKLTSGEVPSTLILGESLGSWKQDYTLAQPHNLLERGDDSSSPKDYVTTTQYQSNYYTNARHLHQSNVQNLADTDAPLMLNTKIKAIEKQENHKTDWQSPSHKYRIKIKTTGGKDKIIYTNTIDFAGGLGTARNIFPGSYMEKSSYEKLRQFDSERGYTPVVDGNQFMLTASEESGPPRKILIYGGGGNATACYRKGFFGDDRSAGQVPYTPSTQKNQMVWFSRNGFEDAGYGTLAKAAIQHGKDHSNLYCGELQRIEEDPKTGKMKAQFILTKGSYNKSAIQGDLDKLDIVKVTHRWNYDKNEEETVYTYEIECDQLISSVGQDASNLNTLLKEFDKDLELNVSKEDVPLGITSKDKDVHIWGAMATQVDWRMYAKDWDQSYGPKTRETIVKENINPDGEWPGVMPPSVGQIRKAIVDSGAKLASVNINVDHTSVIEKYLKEGGAPAKNIKEFMEDIIKLRKETASGITRMTLADLIRIHSLGDYVRVLHHSFIVNKPKIITH